MNNSKYPTANSGDSANINTKSNRKSKFSKFRDETKFREKKNEQFQDQLQRTLLRRLKISDPTTVDSIHTYNCVPPAAIPISFRGVPKFSKTLWSKMRSIGARAFTQVDNPDSIALWTKAILLGCEIKLCRAQATVEQVPLVPLSSRDRFTYMQLRTLEPTFKRVPYPIAYLFEAIGRFTIVKQSVVPVLIKTSPDIASGAVNFGYGDIMRLVTICATPQLATSPMIQIAQEMNQLPKITWIESTQDGQRYLNLSQDSVAFWTSEDYVPATKLFEYVVSHFSTRPGFIIQCDLSHGEGTSLACIRFPEEFDPSEDETRYYATIEVPEYEVKLATAFQLGFEYRGELGYSRYCSNYNACYLHGNASQKECRNAVINL